MKLSLFCNCRYLGPSTQGTWPVPVDKYSSEVAERSLQIALDQARLADEVGFDWISVAEHHYAPFSISPNPMVMAGAMTQVVKNAKIALMGPDVPILNPVRLAEEFAMLDTMSGGRVIAGMMRGTPNEYVTYNINPNESRGRFSESIHLIKKAWTEPQPFGWQGRYFQYRSISIWPRPVQKPHPPMYMSGSSPESGTFAAENRLGLGFAVTTLPAAKKAAAHYRKEARRVGWEPTPDGVIYRLGFHIAETDEEAFADLSGGGPAGPGISLMNMAVARAVAETEYYGSDPNQRQEVRQAHRTGAPPSLQDRIDLGQIMVGSPDTVFKQAKRIGEELGAGVLDVICAGQFGDKTMKSLELMGTKVLPRLRAV